LKRENTQFPNEKGKRKTHNPQIVKEKHTIPKWKRKTHNPQL
jgi:hypothetical protein